MPKADNPFAVASRFAKSATDPAVDLQAWNREQAWGDVAQVGLGGLALGVGARGLTGLYNLLKHNVDPPKVTYPGAMVTRVPIPVTDSPDEDPDGPGNSRRRRKLAGDAGNASPPPSFAPVADYHNVPWRRAGMLGAGALGLYGGWKGLDYLLQHRRKADSEQDIEDARKDFEQSLLESYPAPRSGSGIPALAGNKRSADAGGEAVKLGAALDALYEKVRSPRVKQALTWNDAVTFGNVMTPDTGNMLASLYGMYALGSGGLAGKMTYDSAIKNNSQAALDKAIARRARNRYLQHPSEILAVPDEVRSPRSEFASGGAADQDAERDADASEPGLASLGRLGRRSA